MKSTKYYRLPKIANARRIYATNIYEIAKWAGGEVIEATAARGILSYFGIGRSERIISVPTVDGYIPAHVGEWLVREEDNGLYFTMSDEEFKKTYHSEHHATFEQAMLNATRDRGIEGILNQLEDISESAEYLDEEETLKRYAVKSDGVWYTINVEKLAKNYKIKNVLVPDPSDPQTYN